MILSRKFLIRLLLGFAFLILSFSRVYAQDVEVLDIPDENFRKYIVEEVLDNRPEPANIEILPQSIPKYDSYNLYSSDLSEIQNFELMDFSTISEDNKIISLEGLSYFSKLKTLILPDSTGRTYVENLNLDLNENLETLDASNGKLYQLNLDNNSLLKNIDVSNNHLLSLNLSDLENLEILKCNSNNIREIYLDNTSSLKELYCNDNRIELLNLSDSILLEKLNCDSNSLSALNLSKNSNISSPDLKINHQKVNKIIRKEDDKYIFNFNESLYGSDYEDISSLTFYDKASSTIPADQWGEDEGVLSFNEVPLKCEYTLDVKNNNIKMEDISIRFYYTDFKRYLGSNRFETAVNISKNLYGKSDNVVLAVGTNFPDAMCGAPLAGILNAPILLTEKDRIDEVTENEIKRLGAKKVYILGGSGVISDNVSNYVDSFTDEPVERIGGSDRFETSMLVAMKIASIQEVSKVHIANALNFPDALAAGAVCSKYGVPILLSLKDEIPDVITQVLNNSDIEDVSIDGGFGVISSEVEDSLKEDLNKDVSRNSGKDRFETAVSIARNERPDTNKVYIATAYNFPDALAGSVLASKEKGIVLLSAPDKLPEITASYIYTKYLDIIGVFGGYGAISEDVEKELIKISRD